jgi:hypothetical protein
MPYEERQTLGQGIPVYTHNWIRLLKDQQGTFCVQNLRTGSTEIVLSEEGHSPVDGIAVGVPIAPATPNPMNLFAVQQISRELLRGLVTGEEERRDRVRA